MEALSPRSTNIQARPKLSKLKEKELADEEAKKAEAAKKALKEKEYAPAPPEWVLQPPVKKGRLAEKFRTGKFLGKGGFAICYEGELRNKGRVAGKTTFALKIVKTYMSLKKMEDKVWQILALGYEQRANVFSVSNRAPNPCEDAPSKHRRVSPRLHFQGQYLCRARAMLQRVDNGHGEEKKMLDPTGGATVDCSALRSNQIHARPERHTSRLEDGKSLFGPRHEPQDWGLRSGSSAGKQARVPRSIRPEI